LISNETCRRRENAVKAAGEPLFLSKPQLNERDRDHANRVLAVDDVAMIHGFRVRATLDLLPNACDGNFKGFMRARRRHNEWAHENSPAAAGSARDRAKTLIESSFMPSEKHRAIALE